jgi:hypothetical protein
MSNRQTQPRAPKAKPPKTVKIPLTCPQNDKIRAIESQARELEMALNAARQAGQAYIEGIMDSKDTKVPDGMVLQGVEDKHLVFVEPPKK